jgi:hypothetical protein
MRASRHALTEGAVVSEAIHDSSTTAPLKTMEVTPGAARPAGGETILPITSRLANPDAVLSRSDLRDLGYERRAIDAIFRVCPVVALPGYSRPLIRVSDYLGLIRAHTFNGRDRVR